MSKKALIALIFLSTSYHGATYAADASDCRTLYRLTDLSWAVEPGMVMPATSGVPEHCRLRGVVNRAIRVEVRLPTENWNGRFMFSTVGGGAGSIGDTTSLLAKGFAMASTDTGHEGQSNEYLLQPEALLDYAYRGVHLATQFGKAVTQRYYGTGIDLSYLKGCSNGGRAALMEAIRFPDDYDGIIAGAPAFRFEEFGSWMVGGTKQQARHPLTDKALQVLDDNSSRACDDLDGVKDGVINDPRQCTQAMLQLDKLACPSESLNGCLSRGQIETARYMYADQHDADGNVVSPGVLPGAEGAGDWGFWMLENDLLGTENIIGGMSSTLANLMRHDPSFNIEDFDPNNDRAKLAEAASVMDVQTADLSEFKARGGKLIIYQGWNDYPLRPQRSISYLEEAESHHNGRKKTAEFFRLFMVPGMVHCQGGPGAWVADYVDPLVTWREEGKAPNRIEASSGQRVFSLQPVADAASVETFTRPLCAYPKLASYKGRGNTNETTNFECKAP